MRCDADERALRDELLEHEEVVRAHSLEFAIGDRRRLDVDPFAQPDVVDPLDVVDRPPQVRLHDDAEILVPELAQVAVQAEGAGRRRRVLHVDSDETLPRPGVFDDGLEVLATQVEVEVEPERGQLDRDVRVELVAVDPREQVVVLAGDRPRLVRAGDLLAEHVDGRQLPLPVQLIDDARGIVDRRARDVARREPLHHRSRDSRQETDDRAVEGRTAE